MNLLAGYSGRAAIARAELTGMMYFTVTKTCSMSNPTLLGEEQFPAVPPTADEKTLALLAHVVTFVSNFIAPLIIYIIKKDESPFVAAHAKESLNFQLTILLAAIILFVTIIGILLLWVLGIFALVLVIVATIRASEGKLYRYPLCIRFIK